MPITRKALLISNPGETGEENYCKGVYADIKNYQDLLVSPEGGAWDPNEISRLDRPTANNVRICLAICSLHDYALVMFTGHGWYSSPERDQILELRKGEEIASLELHKGAKKRTIILDCCQKVHTESLAAMKERIALANKALGRTPNRDTCRRLFLDGIQSASNAIVKLTSCSISEVATDDDSRGGRYNASLIECVHDWAIAQANDRFSCSSATLSIVTAHECAAAKTRKLSAYLQNPTIEKPRTEPYFPIAVFG